ncbi:MAG: ABC transporter substrate-binding protein [Candidatus Dependentiae bacterium]|jgi:ABC-type branched-subunit amino acid transport system substrate-binding protein
MHLLRRLYLVILLVCIVPTSMRLITPVHAAEEQPDAPAAIEPKENEKDYAAGVAASIEQEKPAEEEEEEKSEIKTAEEVEAEEAAEEAAATPLTLDADALKVYNINELDDLVIDHSKEIVLAMLGNFYGHFEQYARAIRNGILAHFARINGTGGIHHKHMRLICVEDRNTPALAQRIMNTLRRTHKIELFIGNMGSRNLVQNLRLIKARKVAMLFPWGNHPHLQEEPLDYLVSGAGIMEPQLRALVTHCTETLRLNKIALFYSDGGFNTRTKNTLVELLAEHDITPVAQASYNRMTMDINSSAKTLIKSNPKVVICLGTSMPVAKLMSRFLELGYYGTTFIGVDSTMWVPDILRAKGAAYAYSTTVPAPESSLMEVAQIFRDDCSLNFPNDTTNILSFAYYLNANIITHIIKTLTADFTTKDLLEGIAAMKNVDIGGFNVTFNPETRLAYPHHVSIIRG